MHDGEVEWENKCSSFESEKLRQTRRKLLVVPPFLNHKAYNTEGAVISLSCRTQ